jgi:hypothetical protein
VKSLGALVNQLAKARARAEALGIFVEDRELLTCPVCDLSEDVAIEGHLFTYRPTDLGVDTGLRFGKPHDDGLFRCPSCGAHVAEPIASE